MRGFTLLELLAVMAIIALVGGLGAGAYQVARRNYALAASAGRIQGIIRLARNTALGTGAPSVVTVDPVNHVITALAFERVGEWTFDSGGSETDVPLPAGEQDSNHGGSPVPGRIGEALRFSGAGYFDCGSEGRYSVRTALFLEAWVRHELEAAPKPPLEAASALRARPRARRGAEAIATLTIVEKAGAYALAMTQDGALVGSVGTWSVRTRAGAIPPSRWVYVSLRYDGRTVELSADGVPRELLPLEEAPSLASARPTRGSKAPPEKPLLPPPEAIPSSTAPLTISSPTTPFRGDIDEVKVSGGLEPVEYRWDALEHVIGWKKVLHFDGNGRLDARHHRGGVRIVLVELPDEDAPSSARTAVAIDTSVTFEEWLSRFDSPPGWSERVEEAKVENALPPGTRKVALEVDRLGVVTS